MGTTFRSLMSWGINATAVELVPSVKEAFPYYFDDAREVMSRPNGKIVIDDGRRFLRRTQETFDVITLDPPPPVEAAGSSLLYSNEFYAAVRRASRPVVSCNKWMPNTKGRTVPGGREFPSRIVFLRKDVRFPRRLGAPFPGLHVPIETPSPEVLASPCLNWPRPTWWNG